MAGLLSITLAIGLPRSILKRTRLVSPSWRRKERIKANRRKEKKAQTLLVSYSTLKLL
jgi:hypothetical protein